MLIRCTPNSAHPKRPAEIELIRPGNIFSICYCPVLVNLCRFLFVTDRTCTQCGFLLQHIWFNVPHVVFTDVFLILVDFLSAQTSLVIHCWLLASTRSCHPENLTVDQHVLKQSDRHVSHVQPCHLKSPSDAQFDLQQIILTIFTCCCHLSGRLDKKCKGAGYDVF